MNDKEFEAFRSLMAGKHFARLAEQAGRYIGGMAAAEKERALQRALEFAAEDFKSLSPAKESIVTRWDACLRRAVETEPSWVVRRFDRYTRLSAQRICMEALFK